MKICVDPGHGGKDPGAERGDLHEGDITLQVALRLEDELLAAGHRVLLTRRSDVFVELYRRAEIANEEKCDLFISVHCNASSNEAAQGIEVWHRRGSERGRQWAVKVLKALSEAFPDHRARGVKDATFAVLRRSTMPAILVELEFITNPVQSCFLDDPSCQDALAKAIARGVGAATAP